MFCMLSSFISAEMSLDGPGILAKLKKQEVKKFHDRLFIVSSSQRDIYNVINPDTQDYFSSSVNSNSYFFIEFELEKPISINGFDIYSSENNFPQSFDIEIDGTIVASIKQTKTLNGPGKMMNVKFESPNGTRINLSQTGQNLNKGTNVFEFKRIELQSTDRLE